MNIRIATRGSELALWQAYHVRDALLRIRPAATVELVVLKTAGDRILDVPLAKVGGKGLFVKEIEQALVDNRADLAVHSMKDVPTELAPGLELVAMSAREQPWDALCVRGGGTLKSLPQGARVGTSSLRRQCQLLAQRPDLQIHMLRGNVPTRIRKLEAGEFDAIVLAAAGLRRLGLAAHISEELAPDVCLPASAQGVLALEARAGDADVIAWIRAALHNEPAAACALAERATMARLGGSCQTPLAAYAEWQGGAVWLRALCGTPDGRHIVRAEARGASPDVGLTVADALIAAGAGEILRACEAAAALSSSDNR